MTRTAIVYRSRTGVTRRMAEEMADLLEARGMPVELGAVDQCDPGSMAGVDVLLLGCWTEGLFVIRQHPDHAWIDFVRQLPALPNTRIGLFATYKLATGRMFSEMRRHLAGHAPAVSLELKSRDGHLSAAHRSALEALAARTDPHPEERVR